MSRRKITAGSTSVIIPIAIMDTASAIGGGLGSLLFNSAGLTAKYFRHGSLVWTTFSLQTMSLGAWASGGFIDDASGINGGYQLGIPNAALATGARWVVIIVYGAANMLPVRIEIELDSINYYATGGKLPATIAAGDIAPDAVDAASVKADAVLKLQTGLSTSTAVAEISTTIGSAGVGLTAITSKTNLIPANPAFVGSKMDLVDAPNMTAVSAITSGLATSSGIASVLSAIGSLTFPSPSTIGLAVWSTVIVGTTQAGSIMSAIASFIAGYVTPATPTDVSDATDLILAAIDGDEGTNATITGVTDSGAAALREALTELDIAVYSSTIKIPQGYLMRIVQGDDCLLANNRTLGNFAVPDPSLVGTQAYLAISIEGMSDLVTAPIAVTAANQILRFEAAKAVTSGMPKGKGTFVIRFVDDEGNVSTWIVEGQVQVYRRIG